MARRLLFLISELNHAGAAHQLALLARLLPRERFEVRVCVLGEERSVTRSLQRAGVSVESLGWRRAVDLRALRRLRSALKTNAPDLVHVWGLGPLRWSRLVGMRNKPIVASALRLIAQ